MNISQQVFAPFARTTNDGSGILADVNAFVLRLLLFDLYIVESSMLRDIAQLTSVFGVEGLVDLLSSGVIKVHIDSLTVGQAERKYGNDTFPVSSPSDQYPLPLLHFDPLVAQMSDRNRYIDRSVKNLLLPNVGKKTISRLQHAAIESLTTPPGHDAKTFQWSRESLLSNNEVVVAALEQTIIEKYGRNLCPTAFEFSFRSSGESGYAVSTNIGKIYGLSKYEEHKVFEAVLLKVMGFYQRLTQMNYYQAIAWFSDTDSQLLNAEMKLKLGELNSSDQERRFTRILAIKGLPTVAPGRQINANSLMHLRSTKECNEFRAWLSTSDAKSDQDIERELTSFKSALSSMFSSGITRTIRFVLPTILGLGPVASLAEGVADQGIGKLLPTNGPIAFINNKLPPVLRNDPYKN